MENSSLIAKHFSGNLTPREKQVLDNWRQLDERNEQAFREFEKIWIASGRYIVSMDIDTALEWEKFKRRTSGFGTGEESLVKRINWWTFASVAAAILVLIGLASIFFMQDAVAVSTGDALAVHSSKPQFVEINSGLESRMITLGDSTEVFLNVNSSLAYHVPFMTSARRVYLQGEAYFEVAKNTVPFIVYAGETQVTVVGTAFNLKAKTDNATIELTVVEGKVAFSERGAPAANQVLVEQNEVVTFNGKDNKITQGKMSNTAPWWGKLKWGEKFDWTEKRDELFSKIRKKLR